MSNVIPFNLPHANLQGGRIEAMIKCFATQRRFGDDVFWLKENTELLTILYSSGLTVDPVLLALYREFNAGIEKRILFSTILPVLLSITQDLEALGLGRGKAVPLANLVDTQAVVSAELSNLQRAEAGRLLQRSGIQITPNKDGLTERLHRFMNHSKTFAVPNKNASYELTHIIFISVSMVIKNLKLAVKRLFNSNFQGFGLCLIKMLIYFLKFCIAMRFAGCTPPQEWEAWIAEELADYHVSECANGAVQDHYHS